MFVYTYESLKLFLVWETTSTLPPHSLSNSCCSVVAREELSCGDVCICLPHPLNNKQRRSLSSFFLAPSTAPQCRRRQQMITIYCMCGGQKVKGTDEVEGHSLLRKLRWCPCVPLYQSPALHRSLKSPILLVTSPFSPHPLWMLLSTLTV